MQTVEWHQQPRVIQESQGKKLRNNKLWWTRYFKWLLIKEGAFRFRKRTTAFKRESNVA